MKILIAADMEGVSGVVHWDQVSPGHPDYPRFQKVMTADVNAAISGAFDSGADEVVVSDGHNNGRNILIEALDPRARLNSGTPSPFSMVQGVDSGVHGLIFIGYHARIGTQNAILAHTWSDSRVANLWINGELTGEIGLNAAVGGHFNVPLIMISGDQSACNEASSLIDQIETVVVKRASGRMAAECLPPVEAQKRIRAAAAKSVKNLKDGNPPDPLHLAPPINMAIEFPKSNMADQAALLPGARRTQGRCIEFTAENMAAIYAAFRIAVSLASGS